MNDWVSFIETGHQHHVFSWLLLLQTWTAWHGTAAAAENALTANCCVIISGTAVMGLTSSTAASLVLACYCYYSQTTVSVLFFSRPLSEGWPHHGRTFSIYPCPLSFWLTLPQRVLSTSWCYPSRPCVVFLACVHLALFLALSLSPGNSLVSMLVSLLWRCLTVPSLLQLC